MMLQTEFRHGVSGGTWMLPLALGLLAAASVCISLEEDPFAFTSIAVSELLLKGSSRGAGPVEAPVEAAGGGDNYLDGGILRLWMPGTTLVTPPQPVGPELTLTGRGHELPTVLMKVKWPRMIWHVTWSSVDTGYEPRISMQTVSPPPSSPPLPPPSSLQPPYTILDWFYLYNPAIQLLQGQSLTLRSMAFMAEKEIEVVTGGSLSALAFTPIRVAPGASLRLEDVTIVLNRSFLRQLVQSVCLDPDFWKYRPAVEIGGGAMIIRELTTTAPPPPPVDNAESRGSGAAKGTGTGASAGSPPPPDGRPQQGGQVHWRNVTLTCPNTPSGPWAPLPCAAAAVSDGRELYRAARTALVDDAARTILLSLTADAVALPAANGSSWQSVSLAAGQLLVLQGDPSRAASTILDLSGLPDAWTTTAAASGSSGSSCRSVAVLRDLLLVNLPYPVRPSGPMSLLATALSCFGPQRDNVRAGDPQILIRLERCTIVVPDAELEFLARAVGRNSTDIWPGEPPGSFNITLAKQRADPPPNGGGGGGASGGSLEIQQLMLKSDVLLTNCTLLSASSYSQQLPGAVQLLPQSRLWAPQLLAASDPETFEQWGPGGLAVAPGLQQALTDLAAYGCPPSPSSSSFAAYNPKTIIWRYDDVSVPVLGLSSALVTIPISGRNSSSTGGELAETALASPSTAAAAAPCIVEGSAPGALMPGSSSGRVFSNLQGAIARFALTDRPLTLRNLVLYNLAPGGVYPFNVPDKTEDGPMPPPPVLAPADAAWKFSALPLWFFAFNRSSYDGVSSHHRPPAAAVADNLASSTPVLVAAVSSSSSSSSSTPPARAGPGLDSSSHNQQQPAPPQPLLVLQDVTLVIPEREWRALAAAVLLIHAPEAMAEAQQQQLLTPASPPELPYTIVSEGASSSFTNATTAFAGKVDSDGAQQQQQLDEGRADANKYAPYVITATLMPASSSDGELTSTKGALTGEPDGIEALPVLGFTVAGVAAVSGASALGATAITLDPNPKDPTADDDDDDDSASIDGAIANVTTGLFAQRDVAGAATNPDTPDPTADENFDAEVSPAVPVIGKDLAEAPGPAGDSPGEVSVALKPEPAAGTKRQPSLPVYPGGSSHSDLHGLKPTRPLAALPALPPLMPPPFPPLSAPRSPYGDIAREALLAFAVASRVSLYNYSSGELVLAVVRHYGWIGTNVTITHKMPQDAPPADASVGPRLLPYPYVQLPYDDLADLAIDVKANFSANDDDSLGQLSSQMAAQVPMLQQQQQQLEQQQPVTKATAGEAPPPTPYTPTSKPYMSAGGGVAVADSGSSSAHHAWLVPVVASLAAAGGIGVILVTVAALSGRLLLARRHRRWLQQGHKWKDAGMAAAAAAVDGIEGRFSTSPLPGYENSKASSTEMQVAAGEQQQVMITCCKGDDDDDGTAGRLTPPPADVGMGTAAARCNGKVEAPLLLGPSAADGCLTKTDDNDLSSAAPDWGRSQPTTTDDITITSTEQPSSTSTMRTAQANRAALAQMLRRYGSSSSAARQWHPSEMVVAGAQGVAVTPTLQRAAAADGGQMQGAPVTGSGATTAAAIAEAAAMAAAGARGDPHSSSGQQQQRQEQRGRPEQRLGGVGCTAAVRGSPLTRLSTSDGTEKYQDRVAAFREEFNAYFSRLRFDHGPSSDKCQHQQQKQKQQAAAAEAGGESHDAVGGEKAQPQPQSQQGGRGGVTDTCRDTGRIIDARSNATIRGGMSAAIRALQAELRDPLLELEDVIGLGAFGVVYRGTWRGLPAAVKTLVMSSPQLATGDSSSREARARQRSVLEAAISMSMSHPNVVATYSFDIKPLVLAPTLPSTGTAEPSICGDGDGGGFDGPSSAHGYPAGRTLAAGRSGVAAAAAAGDIPALDSGGGSCSAVKLYIVQELCNGGTLRAALERGLAGSVQLGGTAALLALRLAADVARGMQHIHSCRIVHGDLKPDNVLLALGGGFKEPVSPISPLDLVAKVADFGLSVALSEDATHASNMFHGTPAYLAPEVASAGQISPRADVWAFGLLLIELFYGCTLSVVRQCWAAIAAAGGADPPPPPGGDDPVHPSSLPAFCEDVLASISDRPYAELAARCLSLEPRERPEFGEIAAALQTMYASREGGDGAPCAVAPAGGRGGPADADPNMSPSPAWGNFF